MISCFDNTSPEHKAIRCNSIEKNILYEVCDAYTISSNAQSESSYQKQLFHTKCFTAWLSSQIVLTAHQKTTTENISLMNVTAVSWVGAMSVTSATMVKCTVIVVELTDTLYPLNTYIEEVSFSNMVSTNSVNHIHTS